MGLTQLQLAKFAEVLAKDSSGYKVVWVHGQNCSGCTTSFAGLEWDGKPEGLPAEVSTYLGLTPTLDGITEPDTLTTIDDVLLDIIDLQYLSTIMATGGAAAAAALTDKMTSKSGSWSGTTKLLVVEGSIPTSNNKYCTIGDNAAGTDELYIGDVVADLGAQAAAVVACGTCAAFGGIPAASSDPGRPTTGAKDVGTYLGLRGVGTAVVNVPGCPINPDWLFGTIVHLVLGDLLTNLDSYGRPTFYYGSPIHGGRCPRYQAYCDGKFATQPGEQPSGGYTNPLCLAKIGCKGFSTKSDCAFGGPGSTKGRGWNVYSRDTSSNPTSGNSCINNGFPCMGCVEKGYPDRYSPFLKY
jgi:hydrogenase small subunit